MIAKMPALSASPSYRMPVKWILSQFFSILCTQTRIYVSISNLRVVINMNLKIIDRINRIDRIRSVSTSKSMAF
jgi:hypothetical protein